MMMRKTTGTASAFAQGVRGSKSREDDMNAYSCFQPPLLFTAFYSMIFVP